MSAYTEASPEAAAEIPSLLAIPSAAPLAGLLTTSQVQYFETQGYIAVPSLSSPAELAMLRTLYDRLFAAHTGYADGNYFDFAGSDDRHPTLPQLLMPSRYEPAFHQTLIFRNCLSLAQQLLGPQAEFVFDHAMLKPPGAGMTPWHQDQAFYEFGSRYASINFWIPLQDVTRESGCLRYIPQSSKGGLHAHRSINSDPRTHGLEALDDRGALLFDGDGETACGRAVYVPMAAGDVVIHHRLTLHGAGPNLTSDPRRAYAIGFGVKTAQPLVRQQYAWNQLRQTERKTRHWAALKPYLRLRARLRECLLRMGWY